MKKILAIILLSTITLTGCALVTPQELSNRMDSLDERIDRLEKEEAAEDSGVSESVTYVSSVEIESAPVAASKPVKTARDIQRALKNAGYYTGPIDGKLGPKSRKAIKEFQSDNGLKVDGVAGKKTKAALGTYL